MIPVRLKLRNFMSYGESVSPLEFDGFRLACLCGDNGHGKSALLDAITWALWGRARISERRDSSEDELIHLGKTDMEVEFEFELDGVRYRVIRKRTIRVTPRRRTSSGVLEFQVSDDGDYRALTGDSIHATQRRIGEVLRLDYETFVNSAFILQGRADEFTRKTATDRKRILSDLLGLGYYDLLEERAREQVRRYETERREHQTAIDEIDRELAKEPDYAREVERLSKAVDELALEAERRDREMTRLRGLVNELEIKASHAAEVRARLKRSEANLQTLRGRIAQATARLKERQALVDRADEIRQGHRGLQAARAELEALDARFQELHVLTSQKGELELVVARARNGIESDLKVATARIADVKRALARQPELERQESELRGQLARLEPLAAERDERLQAVESWRGQVELFNATNVKIKEDGSAIRERLDLLAKADATCPICESRLDSEGIARLKARYKDERERMADDYRRNAAGVRQLEQQIEAAQKRLKEIDEQLRQKQALDRSHATVERTLEDLRLAREGLVEAELQRDALSRRLQAGDYAPAEQRELWSLTRKIEALGYDKQRHETVRARIADLARFEVLLSKLESAEADLPREQSEVRELAQLEAAAVAESEGDRARLAELERDLRAKSEAEAQLALARQALDEVITRHGSAREARGEAQQRVNHCQYLRGERAKKLIAQSAAAEEKALHEELAVAFGKKGIQAMIIESAIPEIEREANGILARMTDGRLNVKFETQRDARSGDGVIETLDIKISDELGVRNLELYSGGESFRVNFAIRIALSKLLTRRAGARVQTLVVDEGFGSQDSFGRQRLIEAINSVANDFEKIIVITHIDELKDAFPTRIDVVKGPEGSQITVS